MLLPVDNGRILDTRISNRYVGIGGHIPLGAIMAVKLGGGHVLPWCLKSWGLHWCAGNWWCVCRKPPINVQYKRTFGAPDQGQTLDV